MYKIEYNKYDIYLIKELMFEKGVSKSEVENKLKQGLTLKNIGDISNILGVSKDELLSKEEYTTQNEELYKVVKLMLRAREQIGIARDTLNKG